MTQPSPTAATAAPTSADVARLAGVSRATVSYVLNDTVGGRVSEQTRLRVRAAAEQLGYVPHAAARSLRAGHSGLVLLATPEITFGPLFNEFFGELRAGLRDHGYTAVLYGNRSDLAGHDVARAWAELRPTAVLAGMGDELTPEGVEMLKRSGTRAVLTLAGRPVPGTHSLILDQREVGATAAAHLLARGHRAIGVLMPTDRTLRQFSEPRLAGVRAAAASAGMATPGGVRVEPLELDYTEESAAALAARWRSLGLTALYCYNDEYAALTLAAFQDAGIAVPAEAALVGADDLMLARVLRPRLTSVRVALPAGRGLADLIDRLIREPDHEVETHHLGSSHIIVRDSG
ncbi:DNA-binding LacI/PurR family transcriptional regulator [Streptacidiphilus sp. MAP12-20]|uniref:LacI family DNA-binding transcriptional regulator n=1 Tax=Streptacidiphilus sp. MAP12-20 TaxID=3156299 RepID=UPI003515046E